MPKANTTSSTAARILVVDDMATNRILLKQILVAPEYVVIEAENGMQALEVLRRESIDLVLMDFMMPVLNGVEASARIRGELGLALLPIIMLTTLDSAEHLELALSKGADDYVSKPFNAIELKARVRSAVDRKRLLDHLDDMESVLFSLARMVEARDANTGNHCDRLAHTGVVFGKELGLSYEELEALRRGGVLHDIGKLGIPDAILLKKGKLTDEEWIAMRQHTTIGAALCSPLKTMRRTADIVGGHHEKWNGSGYPKGLAGEAIPLLARVFQIVDIYDALSSERPYKPAFAPEKVIAIMQTETASGFWDPDLMQRFLKLLAERPQDLKLPPRAEEDRSAQIFGDILKSGVMSWYTEPKP